MSTHQTIEKNMIPIEQITNIIAERCSREAAIGAAYLFGSAALDRRKLSSDIDVAILIDNASSEEFPVLSFISSLEKSCGCYIDLVILNRAGEILKHEVRRSGRLIYERDPERRKQFEIFGRKTYEDFLYLHRRHTASVLYGETHG